MTSPSSSVRSSRPGTIYVLVFFLCFASLSEETTTASQGKLALARACMFVCVSVRACVRARVCVFEFRKNRIKMSQPVTLQNYCYRGLGLAISGLLLPFNVWNNTQAALLVKYQVETVDHYIVLCDFMANTYLLIFSLK